MNQKSDFLFADEWGPEAIVKVYDPVTGLRGILVVDNTALGPGKGGIRMTADITEEEVFRLARTMTWKNALAGIPFGGAKAGIKIEQGKKPDKKALMQAFARAIKNFTPRRYIAGPDVNTGEREMQWFVEATGNWRTATGKPANVCIETFGSKKKIARRAEGARGACGIPHEFGSTGFGVAEATKVAAKAAGMNIEGATVAIHGFGNVGTFTYRFLSDAGAKVVLIADKEGALYAKGGFNRAQIERIIEGRLPLSSYRGGERLPPEAFWKIPVDILIPASVTDVINEKNKRFIKTKLIVEAGNIPMSERIEAEFHRKGVVIVPDFVANAGGVISSYAEYRGYNPKQMFELVKRKLSKTTDEVVRRSLKTKQNPRVVAIAMARERVGEAMRRKKKA